MSPDTWRFSCRLLRATLSPRPVSDDGGGTHGAGQAGVMGGPGKLSPGPSFQGLRPSHNNLLPPVSPESTLPTMPPARSCPRTKSRKGRMFQKVAGCELSMSHIRPALGIQLDSLLRKVYRLGSYAVSSRWALPARVGRCPRPFSPRAPQSPGAARTKDHKTRGVKKNRNGSSPRLEAGNPK